MVASAASAATFVPSRATTPSFTRPASWHEPQYLYKEILERLLLLRPKATDGTEVWLPVGRHHPESYIFLESDGLLLRLDGSVDPDSRRTTGMATIIPGS